MVRIFLIILTVLYSSSIDAAEKPFSLRIATMDLPPYGWVNSEGVSKGIIYEMAEEIGVRSGLPFEHKIYPFNRMLRMLQSGEIDILSSQAHQKAMNAGEKLAIQFNIDVIAATKKNSGIEKLDDFQGKNLVYHQGASYTQLDGFPNKIKYVNSYEESIKLLHERSTWYGAVFSEPAYYYFMKKLKRTPNDFGNVIYIEKNKEQWVFVRRDLPKQVKDSIKVIVQNMFNERVYEKLLVKYGKPE